MRNVRRISTRTASPLPPGYGSYGSVEIKAYSCGKLFLFFKNRHVCRTKLSPIVCRHHILSPLFLQVPRKRLDSWFQRVSNKAIFVSFLQSSLFLETYEESQMKITSKCCNPCQDGSQQTTCSSPSLCLNVSKYMENAYIITNHNFRVTLWH